MPRRARAIRVDASRSRFGLGLYPELWVRDSRRAGVRSAVPSVLHAASQCRRRLSKRVVRAITRAQGLRNYSILFNTARVCNEHR